MKSTTEETATPQAEDPQAVAPQATPAEAPAPAEEKELEVDISKLQDPEYLAKVNEQIAARAQEKASGPPAETVPEGSPAAPAPAEVEEFLAFKDGDPIYRGVPFKVKVSEAKSLVQKGRHLEVTMAELAPVLNLIRSSPDLQQAVAQARTKPELAQVLKDAARAALAGKKIRVEGDDEDEDQAASEVDPEDVKFVQKTVAAELKRRGIASPEEEAARTDAATEEWQSAAAANLQIIRSIEGERFDQVRPLMGEMLTEAQSTMPPEKFQELVRVLDDPFAVNAAGELAFAQFYRQASAELTRRTSAPAEKKIVQFKSAPPHNTRLAPGTATTQSARPSIDQRLLPGSSSEDFQKALRDIRERA